MNILLADDHLMCLDGYILALNNSVNKYYTAKSCEEVYTKLLQRLKFDVAILGHNLEAFEEKNIRTGFDCAKVIRRCFPDCKIIMVISQKASIVLYNIYKQEILNALILKSDFTPDQFRAIVNAEGINEIYYSNGVKKAIAQLQKTTSLLESKNREILSYLGAGFKVSQLPEVVNLSHSAVQKRISKMLKEFDVRDNLELIQVVKKQNLL
ncbi:MULTISPECIES: response regulator [unclassified Myroides]|uniref:response regulator n=1 Tax=unclassified Myroides TaxID=2642485 RepID=UPI003D2F8F5F